MKDLPKWRAAHWKAKAEVDRLSDATKFREGIFWGAGTFRGVGRELRPPPPYPAKGPSDWDKRRCFDLSFSLGTGF